MRAPEADARCAHDCCLVANAGMWSALPLRFTGGLKQKPGRVTGEPVALCVGQWSEDVSNVVLTASGADIAGEDALVLVAGGGGDLGGVVAVAGGLGGVSGAQRVAGELAWVKAGGAGAFLDDQSDALGGKRARDRAGAGDATEDRAGGDLGGVDPGAQRADRAGPGRLGVDEQQLVAAGLLVGLGARDPDPQAVGGGGEVLDRQGDELGAAEPDGEAQQQQRAVAQPDGGGRCRCGRSPRAAGRAAARSSCSGRSRGHGRCPP